MKMFSKIMLVSLLTIGCMPTMQVRADWKSATGVGCYVASALAGYGLLNSIIIPPLMSSVSNMTLKVEEHAKEIKDFKNATHVTNEIVEKINGEIEPYGILGIFPDQDLKKLTKKTSLKKLPEWIKTAQSFRENDIPAIKKSMKKLGIISALSALGLGTLGYALRNWIK